MSHWSVVNLRGAQGMCTPWGPNSFDFMQFLGKFGKIVCWRPPGDLAPPPRGNPGSATVGVKKMLSTSILDGVYTMFWKGTY